MLRMSRRCESNLDPSSLHTSRLSLMLLCFSRFPGLCFKMASPKMTLLIFAKGKIVFLGARKREGMEEALRKIWPLLLEFRMPDI